MRILIVTIDQFPNGDAGSVRLLSFCKILKDLGHEVIVIGQADSQPYISHLYQGIEYISLRSVSKKYSSRIMNYIGHKTRLKKAIVKFSEFQKIDSILITLLPINSLLHTCRTTRLCIQFRLSAFTPPHLRWACN